MYFVSNTCKVDHSFERARLHRLLKNRWREVVLKGLGISRAAKCRRMSTALAGEGTSHQNEFFSSLFSRAATQQ